jgi:hypothetical protein
MPIWSTGWRDKFKQWYSIWQQTTHGEAGSVDVPTVLKKLEALHNKLHLYTNNNIYSIEGMALYCKTIIDWTLATT